MALSSILDYKGNTALGGGYGPDGIPAGTGADAGTAFNNMMQDLNRQNMLWNANQYQQKVRDRDAILEAVSKNQIDSTVEDIYRPQLEQQIETIKKINLANPDIKSNPKAWDELQTAMNKFNEMNTYAKANSLLLKDLKKQYAENPDAQFRKTLGEHIAAQLNQGITHLVQPYQKPQDWTEATDYVAVLKGNTPEAKAGTVATPSAGNPTIKVLETKNVTDNGISYKEVVEGSDLSGWERYYSPYNLVEGENKNLPDQLAARAKFMLQDKRFTSDANLNAINSKLDAINKANGLQSGDQRYLPPIAIQNADGTWNIEKDPAYLNMAASLFQHYQLPTKRREIDKDLMKARGELANITQSYASAESSRASAAKTRNDIKIDNAKLDEEIDLLKAQAEKLRRENADKYTLNGMLASETILKLTREAQAGSKMKPLKDINIPVNQILGGDIFSGGATYSRIPVKQADVQKSMAWPVRDKSTGKVVKATLPIDAYMVKDGNDIKYVAAYAKGEDGKDMPYGEVRYVIYDPQQLAANYISSLNQWNISDKDNISMDKATEILNNALGGVQDTSLQAGAFPAAGKRATGANGQKLVSDGTKWIMEE